MSGVTAQLRDVLSSRRLADYGILLKLRLTALFVATAGAGYYVGSGQNQGMSSGWGLVSALFGIGSVIGGSTALNQVIERGTDARMLRTRARPLPTHRIGVGEGLAIGTVFVIAGVAFLLFKANILTALLSLFGAVLYLVVYTPAKSRTSFSTAIGALAGAMPPLLGWTAARGRFGLEALTLSAILFLWQLPHFHSLEWFHRADYKRVGARMLPVIEENGRWTGYIVLASSLLLVPVSLVPFYLHIASHSYRIAALVLSLTLLLFSMRFVCALPKDNHKSERLASELLRASVVYLPVLFGVMVICARSR